jgi:hypothetical protein
MMVIRHILRAKAPPPCISARRARLPPESRAAALSDRDILNRFKVA